LGNPGLKPEVTQELEFGFDATVLGDRLSIEATYYRKTTKDAIVSQPAVPSLSVR
jgi:outer membrane receptor protein involved in Fe transport